MEGTGLWRGARCPEGVGRGRECVTPAVIRSSGVCEIPSEIRLVCVILPARGRVCGQADPLA